MTKLSPAAQAVRDNYGRALFTKQYAESGRIEIAIAAALRAAADQCKIEWNYHPDYPETEWVVVASDLLAIADELEAQ